MAGDTVVGVASVLLTPKATVGDVERLFMLFGRIEFDDLAPIPLADEVAPGVP